MVKLDGTFPMILMSPTSMSAYKYYTPISQRHIILRTHESLGEA